MGRPFENFPTQKSTISKTADKQVQEGGSKIGKKLFDLVTGAKLREKIVARKELREAKIQIEQERRETIVGLRNKINNSQDISRDRAAVRAYQELIARTNPERFKQEIKVIDGVFGPLTRAAYQKDIMIKDGKNILKNVLSTETEQEKKPKKVKNNEGKIGSGSILSSPTERSARGTTLCARTAYKNMSKFIDNAPGGMDADLIFRAYENGKRPKGMLDFSKGKNFNPPDGANVVDIALDTPQLPKYSRDFGHRAVAYKENNTWHVLDPYYGGTTQPIPLSQYLSKFNSSTHSVRGFSFYQSDRLS